VVLVCCCSMCGRQLSVCVCIQGNQGMGGYCVVCCVLCVVCRVRVMCRVSCIVCRVSCAVCCVLCAVCSMLAQTQVMRFGQLCFIHAHSY